MELTSDAFEARLQQAVVNFSAIPPRPPKPSSRRKQAVATLFDEITRLKTQGYDFTEICEFLVEHTGVEMSSGTLRKYWGEERLQRQGKKPQRKRSGKSQRGKKQLLSVQAVEKLVQVDELDEVNQDSPEPAVAINPVTSDDSSDTWPPVGDTWPPVDDRQTHSPPKSESEPEPEQPVKEHESDSDDDDWSGENWEGDDDSYTTGLIREPKFNRIRRS